MVYQERTIYKYSHWCILRRGQQRVSKNHVAETIIPIPPFDEQYRIVTAIEAAFEQLNNIAATLK
jgi:restriction endonuclease S subunit